MEVIGGRGEGVGGGVRGWEACAMGCNLLSSVGSKKIMRPHLLPEHDVVVKIQEPSVNGLKIEIK